MRALSYGSFGELLYALPAPTAAYSNSVTRTCVSANTSTNRAFKLLADYFQPQLGGSGQSLHVVARGFYSTTVTPTLQIQFALDTTQGTFGTLIAGTGAYATESTITGAGFELEADIVCTATGTSGTVQSGGTYQHGGTGGTLGGNNSTSAGANLMVGGLTAITASTAVDQYAEVWATWGTASPSNTLTLTQFLIFALN